MCLNLHFPVTGVADLFMFVGHWDILFHEMTVPIRCPAFLWSLRMFSYQSVWLQTFGYGCHKCVLSSCGLPLHFLSITENSKFVTKNSKFEGGPRYQSYHLCLKLLVSCVRNLLLSELMKPCSPIIF